MLIICEYNDETEQLKPKRPLDVIGMSVSTDVNAYTTGLNAIKLPGSKEASLTREENGFSIDVPCIQKVFRFYTRNLQEKQKWFSAFQSVAQANKLEAEIDRVSF